MSKYNIIKVQLNESQKSAFNTAIKYNYPIQLLLSKSQVDTAVVDADLENAIILPLTSRQLNMLMHSKEQKSELKVDLHLLQVAEYSKLNLGVEIEVDMTNFLTKKTIRRS